MRLRPPLWLFPRRWRERYADEAAEIFEAAGGRSADWLDLLRTGLLLQLETHMRSIIVGALAVVVAASLVALGYTVGELADGPREIHRHWWSAAPLAGLAASVTALLWLRRGPAPQRPT